MLPRQSQQQQGGRQTTHQNPFRKEKDRLDVAFPSTLVSPAENNTPYVPVEQSKGHGHLINLEASVRIDAREMVVQTRFMIGKIALVHLPRLDRGIQRWPKHARSDATEVLQLQSKRFLLPHPPQISWQRTACHRTRVVRLYLQT